MAPKRDDSISSSVAESLGPTSLGRPDVVLGIISAFCADAEERFGHLARGELNDGQYAEYHLRALKRISDIFDGANPEYAPIKGWSGGPLRGQLRVILPDEWMNPERRETFHDNTIAMYFDLLAAHLYGAMQASGGDDEKFADAMRPHIQQAVQLMMGTLR
jgi:hypothetical protein